jgi:hypothetical protein
MCVTAFGACTVEWLYRCRVVGTSCWGEVIVGDVGGGNRGSFYEIINDTLLDAVMTLCQLCTVMKFACVQV